MSNIYNEKYGAFVGSETGYSGFRNYFRVNKFKGLINPQPDEKILEIGCNRAFLLRILAKYSKHVVGIDLKKQGPNNDKKVKCMSATKLEFPPSFFDKVCAFEVLEHIAEIRKVFSETHRVLKSNGRFMVSFPLEIIRGQSALLDACFVYKNPLYARKLHVHKLTPYKVRKIIRRLDFEILESKIVFIPFPSFFMVFRKKNQYFV